MLVLAQVLARVLARVLVRVLSPVCSRLVGLAVVEVVALFLEGVPAPLLQPSLLVVGTRKTWFADCVECVAARASLV